MSTPLSTASTFDAPASSRRETHLPAWAREPLLHFILLGGLLFAVDHFLISRADDPRTIVVGVDVDNEAKQLFKADRGRDPNVQELEALRRVWLDNEVLYREGLAMQVDKGDTAIRERVILSPERRRCQRQVATGRRQSAARLVPEPSGQVRRAGSL